METVTPPIAATAPINLDTTRNPSSPIRNRPSLARRLRNRLLVHWRRWIMEGIILRGATNQFFGFRLRELKEAWDQRLIDKHEADEKFNKKLGENTPLFVYISFE